MMRNTTQLRRLPASHWLHGRYHSGNTEQSQATDDDPEILCHLTFADPATFSARLGPALWVPVGLLASRTSAPETRCGLADRYSEGYRDCAHNRHTGYREHQAFSERLSPLPLPEFCRNQAPARRLRSVDSQDQCLASVLPESSHRSSFPFPAGLLL